MTTRCQALFGVASLFLVGVSGLRADEQLPAPRPEPAEVFAPSSPFVPFAYQRQNRYDVWQYVGVDRPGYYRPLVVYSPLGPYYRYNGQPYPWASMHQREFMPYIVDSPNPPAAP